MASLICLIISIAISQLLNFAIDSNFLPTSLEMSIAAHYMQETMDGDT